LSSHLFVFPYDGGNIGGFLGDAGRDATGSFGSPGANEGISMTPFEYAGGVFFAAANGRARYTTEMETDAVVEVGFRLSNAVNYPTAAEFRVASMIVRYYIVY